MMCLTLLFLERKKQIFKSIEHSDHHNCLQSTWNTREKEMNKNSEREKYVYFNTTNNSYHLSLAI